MSKIFRSSLTSLRYTFNAVGGYGVLTGLVAAAAVIAAVAAPASAWAWVFLVASVLLILGPAVSGVVAFARGGKTLLMGTQVLPRVLVLVAALSAASATDRSALVAASFLVLMVLAEEAMRRPVRLAAPQVANLPGWSVPLPSVNLANLVFALDIVAMVLVVISAALGLGQWPAVVLGAIGLVLAAVITFQAARYLISRNRFEVNLPKTLAKLAPQFAFHWHAPAGTAYQASMWLPYLDRIGVPYFVLVRTAGNFAEVSKLTKAPVLLRSGLEDLDPIVCPSLKAVFYVNTAVRNSHMIRFPHLTHIQLNHGDSDKIASVSPTFRQYDKNFVAGQAAIDRFAKHGVLTRADQFEIVGRPQLELVARADGPIADIPAPTVLYSPTWSGFYDDSDYSSLSAGVAIVSALLERGCTVIFRPHPYARRHKGNSAACDQVLALLEADVKQSGRQHIFGEQAEVQMSVPDCFNASDAMVSDVSSLVSDYLSSGKPFAMGAVSAHGSEFVQEFPLAEAAYVFDVRGERAEGFGELLADMLATDSLAPRRAELRSYYLSDTPPQEMVDRFVDTAKRFL